MSWLSYNQSILQFVVAEICQSVGFDFVHGTTLDVLTDVLERYIRRLSSLTHDITEQCGHTSTHIEDVQHCFRLNNMFPQELIDYIQQMEELKLSVMPKCYPHPKKSNLQLNKNPKTVDLDYVYPYLPSLVRTAASNPVPKSIDVASNKALDASIFANASLQSDEDNNSSDDKNDDKNDDMVGDGDEPLWLKQQIKQSQRQLRKELSHTQGIAPSSVVHCSDPISPFETNLTSQSEQSKASLWDLPVVSRPKLSGSNKSALSCKTEHSEPVAKVMKHVKTKTSITSRIEEVNRLLHDPIIEKRTTGAESSSASLKESNDFPTSRVQKTFAGNVNMEPITSLQLASPNSMDDAIDAVVSRATKEAEEAELMKFSHLIEDFSSSDDSDIVVSHKTEEMLQLQKRGLQKPVEEESPSRPPLTPSPAPSNQSLIIDQEIDVDTSQGASGSSPEQMEISTNTISERTWSIDSPKLSFKASTINFEERLKAKQEQTILKKVKLPKKSKVKAKEKRQQRLLHEQNDATSKLHSSHKKDNKSVEKLILIKSKFGEAKLIKSKEKASLTPVKPTPLPIPKLSVLPKLSAAVPAPLPVPLVKKKDKKEKKRKKEKDERVSEKVKEDFKRIPKLKVKMVTSSSKDTGILKTKQKKKKSVDKKVTKKSLESKVSIKKEVQRGVTTETISIGSKVGVIYDAQGNKVWICPGCNKPDDGSPMIGCDSCDGWYHWPCVNITVEPANDKWYCPNCL